MEARILILSDPHYASAGERARKNFESEGVKNPLVRLLIRTWRYWLWLRDPFAHNYLVDRFIAEAGEADWVVANGDFSCDSAFIGLSDPAARQSAVECLGKLRAAFGEKLLTTVGDHELGKTSLAGARGGLRLASWRATLELGIAPVWEKRVGRFVLIGVTSTLIALDVFRSDILDEEWSEWQKLRTEHLAEVRKLFDAVKKDERIILFCHDPTALPFLGSESWVIEKLPQLERTVIGHLHSPMVFWKSKLLAGCPPIGFCGNGVRRITRALHRARLWKPLNVLLCPSLAGAQLLKDGGYYELRLNDSGAEFVRRRLRWES